MRLLPVALRELGTQREDSLQSLRGARVHAVAGIGNPRRFFALLRELGAHPVEHEFVDHHAFLARDLEFGDTLRIVMTEKDAVKCAAFADDRMWCLSVVADLPAADAEYLLRAVLARVAQEGVEDA
jgi:tetraacyldisaccharide 4'-kinase